MFKYMLTKNELKTSILVTVYSQRLQQIQKRCISSAITLNISSSDRESQLLLVTLLQFSLHYWICLSFNQLLDLC